MLTFFYKKILTSNLIIQDSDKEKILLVRRNFCGDSDGLWSIPGGTKNKNEKIEETLIREIKEELGVDIEKYSKFKKYNYKHNDKSVESYYFYGNIQGSIKLDDKELLSFKWFLLKELPSNLAFNQKEVLRNFIQRNSLKEKLPNF